MMDFTDKRGFRVVTDGNMIEIRNEHGQTVGSYHMMHGDTVIGHHSPQTIVRIRESLNDAKEFLHS